VETYTQYMQCHYCDRKAVYAAEKDGVRVGLCERHFRDRVEELAESEELAALQERINIDRTG
jgi:hypothetical protein